MIIVTKNLAADSNTNIIKFSGLDVNNYTSPCKITSKIINLSTLISEEIIKLQFVGVEKVTLIIEFMLEMIFKSIQNIKDDNVPKNDPIKRLDKIIEIKSENKDITIVEVANKLNVADKIIKRDISKLKEQNRFTRVGSLKSGHWEVKE